MLSIRASRIHLLLGQLSPNQVILKFEKLSVDLLHNYCVTAVHYLIPLMKPTTFPAGSSVIITYYGDSKCAGISVSNSQKATIGNCDFVGSYHTKVTIVTPSTSTPSKFPSTSTPVAAASSVTSSSSRKNCFAGSETVTLESGEMKPISEVRAGDRVLAADASRQTVFSEVVFVPHASNADKAVFTRIVTTQGRDIKMTHSHILPAGACGSTSPLPDAYASSVTVSDCIMTVSGMEEVSAVETVQGQGLYTIVTKEEYLVVNGIIASPFAYNHMVANFYYNVHRFVYACVPGLLSFPVVHSANEVPSPPTVKYPLSNHYPFL